MRLEQELSDNDLYKTVLRDEIDKIFEESNLPDKIDEIFINKMIINIRKKIYNL